MVHQLPEGAAHEEDRMQLVRCGPCEVHVVCEVRVAEMSPESQAGPPLPWREFGVRARVSEGQRRS